MNTDPYRNSASKYDRLFEGMNKGLRIVGMRMFRPSKGMSILDVGCGTGTHLGLYQRYQCHLFGLDASPAMLEVAHQRLGNTAHLYLGSAADMPYPALSFDLVITMLTLHEMAANLRPRVLAEIKRVIKPEGRLLLIDYHPGPYQFLQGWTSKVIITVAEVAAGRDHFRHYRQFLKTGGLQGLIDGQFFMVEKQQVLAGGTLSVRLFRRTAAAEQGE